MSAMQTQPDGAAFDVVLLLHVACVVVGLVVLGTAAAAARRLRRALDAGGAVPEALHRYFRPGVNWAARTVYGIPLFGAALLAMSKGAYDLGEGWVLAGVGLFAAVAVVGEAVVWPAERRLQAVVGAARKDGAAEGEGPDVARDAVRMARGAAVALVLLVAGSVVMVAQP
jgi:uncharacterized membrane protein